MIRFTPTGAVVATINAPAPRDRFHEGLMGKRDLQPDRFPKPVRRDAYGDAIVETERPTGPLSNLPAFGLPGVSSVDLPDIDLLDLDASIYLAHFAWL